jgi:hypothetical protein
METKNILYSQDDVGFSTNDNQVILYSSSANNLSIINKNYSPQTLTLGSTATIGYWADPTLGSQNYTDDKSKIISENGIPIVININSCSGIYSKLPIATGWNTDKGGIEINDNYRPDMGFTIGGDYATWNANKTGSRTGYWAIGEDVIITFTCSSVNLLYGGTEQRIKGLFWHYDNSTGSFNLGITAKLDLSNAPSSYLFTDPNFVLSNCIINVKVLNKYGVIIASKEYTGVSLDPPNATGSISVSPAINKTDAEVYFSITMDSNKNSVTYTELQNVKKCVYSRAENKIKEGSPVNYTSNFLPPSTIMIPSSTMKRGDYCYVSYEPKLAGIKPAISGGIAYSDMVSFCKGHRFSIDDVKIQFMVSGSYESNVIDNINNLNPYIFINPTGTVCYAKITFDANHEDWSKGTSRDKLPDSQIYPYITKVYAAALQTTELEKYLAVFKSIYTPYDSVETYPNVELSGPTMEQLFTLGIAGLYYNSTTLTPNTYTSLSDQSIEITISKSGRYKFYIGIEDQFNQASVWCVTNKANNFNIPF